MFRVGDRAIRELTRQAAAVQPAFFARELARFARDAGLQPTEVLGMTYNPLSRRYRLGADIDVNYLLRCVL